MCPFFLKNLQEPKPFEIWEGTWNATTYTRSCVQFSLISNLVIGEEDCLHLNVFTPKVSSALCSSDKLLARINSELTVLVTK